MSFFRQQDPDVRDLIAYVVARAADREAAVTRTKLVKLLYLIDVEQQARARKSLTGLEWIFYHYGPFSFELAEQLDRMEGNTLVTRTLPARQGHEQTILYVKARDPSDADLWPEMTRSRVNKVVDRWAGEDLYPLLDYVYFQTAPMKHARRGDRLDLSLAAEVGVERRQRPLEPPERQPDAEQQVAKWLSAFRERLPRVSLDPPPRYDEEYVDFVENLEGSEGAVAEGRLVVPEDCEI